MGGCLSSPASPDPELQSTLMANVISSNGQLWQYTTPVLVCQVLFNSIFRESQGKKSSELSLLCNSDSLYYNQYLQPMDKLEKLQAGQIYFMFPPSKLGHILTASDMAALAVKASIALKFNRIPPPSKSEYSNRGKRINRISPVLEPVESEKKKKIIDCESANSSYGEESSMKLQRLSYRRPRMAAISSKVNLSTIYEGSVLV